MTTATATQPETTKVNPTTGLRIYNTLTRKKETFQPVTPGKVGIYLCGPTVYKEAHIGHMVGPVIFDSIKRFLTHSGYQVTLVVNITDVDDKLIKKAAERGIPMSQVAAEMTADYLANLSALGVDQIDHMPTATGSNAATSAPNASTSTISVSGRTRTSLRLLSSALTVRMSRSSAARPVTMTR